MALPAILSKLLSLPTAAFVEDHVLDAVQTMLSRCKGVSCAHDRFGNLLAHYKFRPPAGTTPVVFSAHTDHPGFVASEMLDKRTLRCEFRGGVFAEYFAGTGVRFWSGDRWIKGRVKEVTKVKEVYRLIGTMRLPEEVVVSVREPVAPNSPGMWDLPDPYLKGDIVYARGCDDVAGAAAMVALLDRLSRKQAKGEVYCLFTRAEEVGFVGAIAACKAGTIPNKKLPIVAIETSSARGGGADIGAGPVLRVGDKTSVFPPHVTDFCYQVALKLSKRRKSFKFQRKLMAGGTCESTAFAAYGYPATGICLALGNYHNMDLDKKRIAPETISLTDWKLMVDWFEAIALDLTGVDTKHTELIAEMEGRFDGWRVQLDELASRYGRRAGSRKR